MTNERAPHASEALSAKAAFVVHLTGGYDPGSLTGRVEHVVSGHSLRFASIEELVAFMQRAVVGVR